MSSLLFLINASCSEWSQGDCLRSLATVNKLLACTVNVVADHIKYYDASRLSFLCAHRVSWLPYTYV
jgi:hypothetical protein